MAVPHHTTQCFVCGKKLSGRQSMFCSIACKAKYHSQSTIRAQNARGMSRKRLLIEKMGGACCKCGYKRNLAALEFHHKNKKKKSFQLDMRSLSNRSLNKILVESKKCILICANCHRELHHPQYND
jgi:hypothetical protein